MNLTLILLAIGIVAIAVFLLSFNIIFRKNGKFPNTHISRSKEMKKRGISCAASLSI